MAAERNLVQSAGHLISVDNINYIFNLNRTSLGMNNTYFTVGTVVWHPIGNIVSAVATYAIIRGRRIHGKSYSNGHDILHSLYKIYRMYY